MTERKKKEQIVRSAYHPHVRERKYFSMPSRTKQSFAEECDINNIMLKYKKTGLIDHVARYPGGYADLADVVEYHEGLNMIAEAKEAFQSLPAALRARFDNDPGQFLAFVENPENLEELREMGLALPKEPTEPPPAEPLAAPAAPAPIAAAAPVAPAEGTP